MKKANVVPDDKTPVDFTAIEKKWQTKWEKEEIFEAERSEGKKKFFMIFAYPGVSGYLHVGHMRGFSYSDMVCRYKRMQGFNVLFPVGTHASGNQAIAFAKKIQEKDKEWIAYLTANGCSKKNIAELTTPEKIVDYFNSVYQNDFWKRFGLSSDWRRFTCTIFPDYNRFIQWQFKKLQDRGLLTQKPYFATACPVHGPLAVDASETDISKGGSAEKQEFTLLKFKHGNKFLVAATLRPETIFGQTNLWINPKVNLVEISVREEEWIVSRSAYEKLKHQKDNIKLVGDFTENLIGKYVIAPGIEKEIPILPSRFVEADVGTGIVTCVPSDAPYDYIALKELQENEKEMKKYKLDVKTVKAIRVIPIISTKKYGENAGANVVENNSIRTQDDERLVELTAGVYKEGFHTGVLLNNCGKYSGMRVVEAKEAMKKELIDSGAADVMYDLSEEVICRCGERVIIRRIDDQWFIRYSDPTLTEDSKNHAQAMTISPRQYKENIARVLEWFSDRACARLGSWLGTRLPFDKKWTVEPISDSTLYPLYYLVSSYYNQGKITLDEMNEEFFDYVYLGKGTAQKKIWEEIRRDVLYWYPLDVNLGGKEHQTVHFPVFIMNHVGILPKEMWPRGIFVNYWVLGKGSKISKSKGGAQPIPEAIEKFGVDAMRLYYAHIAGPEFDVIWDENVVMDYRRNLERIYHLILEAHDRNDKGDARLDVALLNDISREVGVITSALDSFDLRVAANSAFFLINAKMKKYLAEGGAHKATLYEALKIWIRVMAPFCPHMAEELWEKLGEKGMVSLAPWPHITKGNSRQDDGGKKDLMQRVVTDILNVTRHMKEKNGAVGEKVYLYAIPKEKELLDAVELSQQVGKEIIIFAVNDPKKFDPQGKASKAKLGKPSIYVA